MVYAIISLIIGTFLMVTWAGWLCFYPLISLLMFLSSVVLGIIGLIKSIKRIRIREIRGEAIAGLIISAISLSQAMMMASFILLILIAGLALL